MQARPILAHNDSRTPEHSRACSHILAHAHACSRILVHMLSHTRRHPGPSVALFRGLGFNSACVGFLLSSGFLCGFFSPCSCRGGEARGPGGENLSNPAWQQPAQFCVRFMRGRCRGRTKANVRVCAADRFHQFSVGIIGLLKLSLSL